MASGTSQEYEPSKKLKDLNITREELAKFSKAFKDENFRKLLGEYVQEIQDPENRKRYEEEIALLEQERGYDVTWIHPQPGFVLKLQAKAGGKAFINVCSNANVGAPSCAPSTDPGGGQRGLNWSIPYAQSRPREDRDKAGAACKVYDVVFHPDTLYMAGRNPQMRRLVEDTALQAVEDAFQAGLKREKVAYPKLKYKGVPQASVVRKKRDGAGDVKEEKPLPETVLEKLRKEAAGLSLDDVQPAPEPAMAKPGAAAGGPAQPTAASDAADSAAFETPEYTLVHRDHLDLQQFTLRGGGSCRPSQLVLRIRLPKLTSAAGLDLDVGPQTVKLRSAAGQPAQYRLDVVLPLPVDDRAGGATFDRSARCLVVTLPVVAKGGESVQDSGIDSDGVRNESDEDGSAGEPAEETQEACAEQPPREEPAAMMTTSEEAEPSAPSPSRLYSRPRHALQQDASSLQLHLQEPNLEPGSVQAALTDRRLTVTAISVGEGLVPLHYRLRVTLPRAAGQPAVRRTEQGVVVTLEKGEGDWSACHVDGDDGDPQETLIPWKSDDAAEDAAPEPPPPARPSVSASSLCSVTSYDGGLSVSSQSSVDESCGQKSILKKRYCSESSVDDVFSTGSSLVTGSLVTYDEVDEARAKKAVRFSDHVVEKRYRSNSTILHDVHRTERQRAKKKRQRQARRHSEGDASENEEFSPPAKDGAGGLNPPLPAPAPNCSSSDCDTSENDEFSSSATEGSGGAQAGGKAGTAKKRKNKRKQDRKRKEMLNNELMFDLDV